MRAIEELLRKAIAEGKLEGLSGKGKPLRMEDNPHEDPKWKLAHHILAESGFTLPWIETRREIQTYLDAARSDLKLAWERRQEALDDNQDPEADEAQWQRAAIRFISQVEEINRRIRSYNLAAPIPQLQLTRLSPEAEIRAIMHSPEN